MLNVKRKKVDIDNSRTECGKKMSKLYLYWVKKDLFGMFLDIEGDT